MPTETTSIKLRAMASLWAWVATLTSAVWGVLAALGAGVLGAFASGPQSTREARSRSAEPDGRAQLDFIEIFEGAASAGVIVDPEGLVRAANQAAHRLLGRAPGTLLGYAWADLNLGGGDGSVAVVAPTDGVLSFEHPDGGLRELSVVTRRSGADRAPLNRAESHEALVAWLEDVTERNRTAAQLDAARARLMQAERLEALGTLAGGLAHDFNNLLAPIIGHVDLAKLDLEQDSAIHEDLDLVKAAAQRATELATRLLHLARPERDQSELVPLQDILHEVVGLLNGTRDTAVEIVEEFQPTCPPVMGTKTQLHQVLFNICKNAVHAMPGGGRLTVSVDSPEALATWEATPPGDGPFVRVRIVDTGTGMDQETVKRIFEPFFSTKGESRGSGLGLSMVKTIVSSFDGTISVQSSVGKGTSFTLLFPAAGQSRVVRRVSACEEPRATPPVDVLARVLVVDDDAAVLDVLTRVLNKLGYQPTPFVSSAEALDTFLGDPHAFDLLLTDQMMPALSGLELADRVSKVRPDVPVVVTTGRVDALPRDELDRLGCHVLPKPSTALELGDAVARGLAGAGSFCGESGKTTTHTTE